jgi:hypothetical protein
LENLLIKSQVSPISLCDLIGVEPSFIELLKRNGFLVDDSVKKERKRPWHLPKVKTIEEINDNQSEHDYV